MGGLVDLIIILLIVGLIFWLLVSYVMPALPIPEPFKAVIIAVMALIVILYLASRFLGLHAEPCGQGCGLPYAEIGGARK